MPDAPVLLLVEDDPSDARLIQRALTKVQVGARVVHVSDGDEAVSYLAGENGFTDKQEFPDPFLVLLDVKLPRRSGLEVLRWIRAQESNLASTPVVMFTSSNQTADINTAYMLGANSYLVKPDTSDQLVSMMHVVKTYWFRHNTMPIPKQTMS
ncbi:MAG TPA: response regulator [Terriglobales bacterium]|jgi:CheY-like chemotaxis protein